MASGKIGISVDSAGRVTMHFLTCSATLPDKKGLFFMSPSCGSGKSTVISKVAARATGGVLIVVSTIEAAKEMSEKIKAEGRKDSEICVLHSQDLTVLDTYRDNPMSFTDIPVLILTSARIQIDPIQPFITFKGGRREMILIDELINFYPDPFEIPAELQDILTYIDTKKSHGGKPAMGDETVDGKTYYRHIYGRIEEMEVAVRVAKKRLKNDILKGKGGLNSFKRKTIFEHVLKNGFVPIQKKIVDLAVEAIVIVFDGTADIIIPKSDHRLIPITGTRYSSDIQFGRFEFGMKRNNNEYWQESDIQKMAPEFIKLAVSLSQTEKILVICWKTIRLDITKNTGNADTLENPDLGVLGFPEILRRVLVDAGGKDENIFITYRGSGHDRGSNEFVECSSVLFLGEWRLPAEPITSQISGMFGFKMRFFNYQKSLLVQTICRSRIRQHQGLRIKVWFSSDIDYQMAWEVQEYFKANSSPGCKISGIIKPFRKLSKPMKSHLYQITRLYSYDPRIRSSIESGSAYCFSIDLDGLDRFVHLKYKKRNHYRYLQKALKEFGITMTIL